jgi:hypothetical protein
LANPTTNYGWVLPTPTDLVTDLPADFDVALQGVDTRLKALQPGTTLGDLAYSSATANTNTRLGIGTTGQVLTVDGGVPSWSTISAGAWTLISTTTLTGQNVTITGISQSYKFLKIVTDGIDPSANGTPQIVFRNSGGSNIAFNLQGLSANNTAQQLGATSMYMDGGLNSQYLAGNTSNRFTINIDLYSTTNRKGFSAYGGNTDYLSNPTAFMAGGFFTGTSAIEQLFIDLPGAATFTAGTVYIYGGN